MPRNAEESVLDPAHLQRIEDFSLLAQVVVNGGLPGIHRSLRQGRGTEFFQYRPYEHGEDLKVVDWKIFAKRNELVAKTFQEDTNFTLFLVIDASGSMGYQGSRGSCSKLRYASMLAACFAYLGNRQGDRVGLFAYGEEVQQWIRPATGSGHLNRILRAMASIKPLGKNQHVRAWEQLSSFLTGRSMIVFLSDFLEAEVELTERLRFSSSAHYDSLCLQVLDRDEVDLPKMEALRFAEMEGDREVSASPDEIRIEYQREMEKFQENLKGELMTIGAEFEVLFTDQDLGYALRRFLGMRFRS